MPSPSSPNTASDTLSRYRDIVLKKIGSLFTLKAVIFWALFFSVTWFYLWRKIVDWDLWWHMAAGRFRLEKGYYPPLNTFIFSPVQDANAALNQVVLGDIVLYLTYLFGGFPGLQFFRVFIILIAVATFLHCARKKLNIWTLLGTLAMVLGTLQAHLIKNAIFAMLFLSLIVYLWTHILRAEDFWRKVLLPLFFIPIFYLWGWMHGTTLVGLGILFFIIIGHTLDRLFHWGMFAVKLNRLSTSADTSSVDRLGRQPLIDWEKDLRLDLAVFLALIFSFFVSYKINEEKWTFFIGDLVSGAMTSISEKKTSSKDTTAEEKAITAAVAIPFQTRAKSFFRQVWKGGDADNIAEYQYPVDIRYGISAKALFVFVVLYILYFTVACLIYLFALFDKPWAVNKASGLYLSMLLPGLASIHLGMGYLRTVAYTFLIALPFMAYGLSRMGFSFRHPWLKGMLFAGTFTVAGYISIMAWQQYYFYAKKEFAFFSGFIDTEQGWGKTNKFRDTIPRYVLKHYPNERLMNSYNIGGYLIWEYYLDKQVFIDGRSTIFQPEFYDDYKLRAGMTYIDKYKLKRGVFSHYVDKDRIALFMRQNWAPIVFDNSMVILERSDKPEDLYGKIPEFIIDEKEVIDMDYVDKLGFGLLVKNTVNYLLLFGRIADCATFVDRYRFMIDHLAQEHSQEINGKRPFIKNMRDLFGDLNHPALGELCQKLFQGKDDKNHLYIADTCVKFGKYEVAVEEYLLYLKVFPDSHEVYSRLASQLLQLGRRPDAITALQHAIKYKPDHADHYNNLGVLYYTSGNLDLAEAMYRKALELQPDDPMAMFNQAVSLQDKGKILEAAELYRRILQLKPDFSEARKRLNSLNP